MQILNRFHPKKQIMLYMMKYTRHF